MSLSDSIHGYRDERLTEMDPEVIYSINHEANKDFVKRTLPGTIVISLLLITSGFIYKRSEERRVGKECRLWWSTRYKREKD